MPVPIQSSAESPEILMNERTATGPPAAPVPAPGCARAREPSEIAGTMATRASVVSATDAVARCRSAIMGSFLTAWPPDESSGFPLPPHLYGSFGDDAGPAPVYAATGRLGRGGLRGTGATAVSRVRYRAGTCSSGMGGAENSRLSGMASQRAHAAERETRALSVAMPVLPYICRYSLDTSMNARR